MIFLGKVVIGIDACSITLKVNIIRTKNLLEWNMIV